MTKPIDYERLDLDSLFKEAREIVEKSGYEYITPYFDDKNNPNEFFADCFYETMRLTKSGIDYLLANPHVQTELYLHEYSHIFARGHDEDFCVALAFLTCEYKPESDITGKYLNHFYDYRNDYRFAFETKLYIRLNNLRAKFRKCPRILRKLLFKYEFYKAEKSLDKQIDYYYDFPNDYKFSNFYEEREIQK